MFKRVISVALTIIMAVSLVSGLALADEAVTQTDEVQQAALDGAAQNGWVKDSRGDWFYYENGSRRTGWLKWNGSWYYLQDDCAPLGAMLRGTTFSPDLASTYLFGADGAMVTSWVSFRDGETEGWNYYGPDGRMAYGWRMIGGRWYWFDDAGTMAAGSRSIGGTVYCFEDSGKLRCGWYKLDGLWYYYDRRGQQCFGFVCPKGVNADGTGKGPWYYLDAQTGAMQTGWFETASGERLYADEDNGAMATGWRRLDGSWYYFRAGGAMKTAGWLKSGGVWYYLKDDGKMADSETLELGGARYRFAAGGRWAG